MKVAVLDSGGGAWVFESLARELSRALGVVPLVETPTERNYLLAWDGNIAPAGESFIPFSSIEVATDKRLIARAFEQEAVPCPTTLLLDETELEAFLQRESSRRWLLKFPTGCGGTGHRFIEIGDQVPADWPGPLVVQEFISMNRPEVFRLYGVAGELFGANARRCSEQAPSVFVAHARGARYEAAELPEDAFRVARSALEATGLFDSFGCVDLLLDTNNRWLASWERTVCGITLTVTSA